MPAPSDTDSLLVLLRQEGSEKAGAPLFLVPDGAADSRGEKISFDSEGLWIASMPPGQYTIGGIPFSLVEKSVTLFQHLLVSDQGEYRIGREVTSNDRQLAVRLLSSMVGFEQWFGREYVGFGPYRPKMYLSGRYHELTFDPEPKGAQLFIDGQLWGDTPRRVELAEGRYLVELRKEGFISFRRIVLVESSQEISPELTARVEESDQVSDDTFTVMVFPFIPFDSAGRDVYGPILTDSIRLNFMQNPGLSVVKWKDDGGAVAVAGSGGFPDFSAADGEGADLLVAGQYDLREDSLLVQAALYDVKSRRIKYAGTYTGRAGIAVFDSIDQLSEMFAAEVGRTLPEGGEPILEIEESSGELISYERSLFRKKMIDQRLQWKHLLSVSAGFGGVNDQHQYETDGLWEFGGEGGNPVSVVSLNYVRPISPSLSLVSMFEVHTLQMQLRDSVDDRSIDTALYSLMIGPEFDFRSEASEVYFRPLLRFGFLPEFSFLGSLGSYDYGPFIYSGLFLDVGYRIYRFRKSGQRPLFLEGGMIFDIATFRFSSDPGNAYVPLHGRIYLSAGMGL